MLLLALIVIPLALWAQGEQPGGQAQQCGQMPGPGWWVARGVLKSAEAGGGPVAANDYAAVNQGQLKNMARGAVEELEAKLPGGAGAGLRQMVGAWAVPTERTQD